MARGPRLPEEPVRDVPVLFPVNQVSCTDEEERFYRQLRAEHGGYMLACDRQSDRKELSRKGATGQIRRVEMILAFVQPNRWLPQPQRVEAEGRPPYDFDRRLWFVDGEKRMATGLAANPKARPEFWRMYRLAHALAERGCGPEAIIIGEATRLFRDTNWLQTFVRSFWDAKIEVIVAGFGPVTEQTLPGLIAMINALSAWLPLVSRGAREARRRDDRIFHGQPPRGLLFSKDKDKVFADPKRWPFIFEMVHRLADGRLPSMMAAPEWARETYGLKVSYSWVQKALFSRWIEGVYDGAYRNHCEPRKLRQRPWTDLDVTDEGYRRYKYHPLEDLLEIPVDFEKFGQSPVPPSVLAEARRRCAGAGRKASEDRTIQPRNGMYLSARIVRCAVCGFGVYERYRPDHPDESAYGLNCRCVDTLRVRYKTARAAVRERPECRHCLYRALDEPLEAKVWKLLQEHVTEAAIPPGTDPGQAVSQQ